VGNWQILPRCFGNCFFFEPQFKQSRRIENAKIRVEQVGLSILSKQIIDLMGGSIIAQSEAQVGSTFTVCIELNVG